MGVFESYWKLIAFVGLCRLSFGLVHGMFSMKIVYFVKLELDHILFRDCKLIGGPDFPKIDDCITSYQTSEQGDPQSCKVILRVTFAFVDKCLLRHFLFL